VGVAADDERLALELGPLELLDGGEEGIHVEVREDHPNKRTVSGRSVGAAEMSESED
jgi:hypothetical protein